MSGDWTTDSEEFADRMMEKITASARLVGENVEVEMSKAMVDEVLAEMGVCKRCGLKREHHPDCPESTR